MIIRFGRVAVVFAAAVVSMLSLTAQPVHAAGSLTGPVTVNDVPIGWYRIQNLQRPGECMQADPATAPNIGTVMYMWPCNDSTVQRWFLGSTNPNYGPGYREVRNGAGRCLDVHQRGSRLTRTIHLFDCTKSRNQAWSFSDPPGQGVVCVHVAIDCDLVIDQSPDFFDGRGYRINLWDESGAANQTFFLEPVA